MLLSENFKSMKQLCLLDDQSDLYYQLGKLIYENQNRLKIDNLFKRVTFIYFLGFYVYNNYLLL